MPAFISHGHLPNNHAPAWFTMLSISIFLFGFISLLVSNIVVGWFKENGVLSRDLDVIKSIERSTIYSREYTSWCSRGNARDLHLR
jgi:hypothetical protein